MEKKLVDKFVKAQSFENFKSFGDLKSNNFEKEKKVKILLILLM